MLRDHVTRVSRGPGRRRRRQPHRAQRRDPGRRHVCFVEFRDEPTATMAGAAQRPRPVRAAAARGAARGLHGRGGRARGPDGRVARRAFLLLPPPARRWRRGPRRPSTSRREARLFRMAEMLAKSHRPAATSASACPTRRTWRRPPPGGPSSPRKGLNLLDVGRGLCGSASSSIIAASFSSIFGSSILIFFGALCAARRASSAARRSARAAASAAASSTSTSSSQSSSSASMISRYSLMDPRRTTRSRRPENERVVARRVHQTSIM